MDCGRRDPQRNTQTGGMGIRYYAYPLRAELVEVAKRAPRSFLSDDPLADAWGPADQRPAMLYLDKCWHELQMLLNPDQAAPGRPAFWLVEGDVTQTQGGWIPYMAVLDAQQVAEVARDLATVTPAEVRGMLATTATFGRLVDRDKEFGYVTHYLADALAFTTRLSERGKGLVYMIG